MSGKECFQLLAMYSKPCSVCVERENHIIILLFVLKSIGPNIEVLVYLASLKHVKRF